MNKKIVLLVIAALIITIFSGCNKTLKTPDNFDNDLWRDSMKVIDIMYETIEREDNFSVEDEDIIKKYFKTYKGRVYNLTDEYNLIYNIENVYSKYISVISSTPVYLDEKKDNLGLAIEDLQELIDGLSS